MYKDFLIAIPSKGRAKQLERNTWGWLQHTKHLFKFFIEPKDLDEYKFYVGKENIVLLPENDKGLYFAKKQIYLWSKFHKIKYIFKLDDDVQSWRDPANRGLGKNAPKRSKEYRCKNLFDPIVENSREALKQLEEVGGISLSYGNEMRNFDGEVWKGINKRFQSCYITKTEFFDFNLDEGGVFEDFLSYVYIRSKGLNTLQYGLTGMDIQPVGKNFGGHQMFDRRKVNEKEKKEIEKLFPWLKWKRVQKDWNWEPDFRKTIFP